MFSNSMSHCKIFITNKLFYHSSQSRDKPLSHNESLISVIAFLPKPLIQVNLVSVHLVNCSIDKIFQLIKALRVLGESPIISIGV
jgi:hypothetical protein